MPLFNIFYSIQMLQYLQIVEDKYIAPALRLCTCPVVTNNEKLNTRYETKCMVF